MGEIRVLFSNIWVYILSHDSSVGESTYLNVCSLHGQSSRPWWSILRDFFPGRSHTLGAIGARRWAPPSHHKQ